MKTVALDHHERWLINDSDLLNDVKNLSEFERAIKNKIKEKYPYQTDDDMESESDINIARNHFKGMSLEILWEFVVHSYGDTPTLGFKYSKSTSEDKYRKGIDREDVMTDGNKGITQIKYTSRPDKDLDYGRLVSTLSEWSPGIIHITIVSNTSTKRDKNKGIHFSIIDSLNRKKRELKKLGSDLRWRHIGREDLEHYTSEVGFWDSFRNSLILSCQKIERTELVLMWDHQAECLSIAKDALLQSKRSQFVIPTGGGKTRVEWELTNYAFSIGKKVVVLFAPWIDLLKQHKNEFNEFGAAGWTIFDVRSGDQDDLTRYDEIPLEQEQSTSAVELAKTILGCLETNKPLLLLSTYKSALRLVDAASIVRKTLPDFNFDIAIGDEAHHLASTNEDKHILLRSDAISCWSFFTATRKIGSDNSLIGMNNESLFGNVGFSITAKELAARGIIVLPSLRIVRVPTDTLLKKELTKKDPDLVDDYRVFGGLIKSLKLHESSRKGRSTKAIVFNDGVLQAHGFANSVTLHEYFPDWTHVAISSKDDLMDGQKRKDVYATFKRAQHATLQQYGIVKEGTDISGITAAIFLREINPIGFVQGGGRTLRILPDDRKKLATGEISVDSPDGWDKYRGEIIVVLDEDSEEDFKKQVKGIVLKLIEGGYERGDVEFIEREDAFAESNETEPNVNVEFLPAADEGISIALFDETDDIRSIVDKCYEEIDDDRESDLLDSMTKNELINLFDNVD